MFINQRIPMEITPIDQEAVSVIEQNAEALDPVAQKMDAATQELSSFIGYLCDKYGAEFIVQRVIFTFIPRPEVASEKEA